MQQILLATELSLPVLLYSLAVALAAGFVRGYAGFGFSALMIAGLSVMLPPVEAVPTILMLEVVASIHMLPGVWRRIEWNLLLQLLIGALAGLPVGVYALASLPDTLMRITIYGALLLLSVFMMMGWRLKSGGRPLSRMVAGLVSGVLNGASALGGLPLVMFLAAASVAAASIRASLVAYFFATDLVALAFADMGGLAPAPVWIRTLVFALPMIIGIWAGSRRFEKSQPDSFKRIVILLLMGLSLLGLVRSAL